jgi:hypothetical protein
MIEHDPTIRHADSAGPGRQPAAQHTGAAGQVRTLGLGDLLQPAMLPVFVDRMAKRLWSTRQAIGFRRDLAQPFAAPAATIPIDIVELGPDELPGMLDPTLASASELDILECASRRALWARHFGRCFVATAPDGQACFVQWLFDQRDNGALARHFGDSFPPLQRDETLLEGAYTPAAFRGLRIMPAAMARIAAHAADTGARFVHTFVGIENLPSLKGCVRAGFAPHQWRTQRLRLLSRDTGFAPLPATFAQDYAAIFS